MKKLLLLIMLSLSMSVYSQGDTSRSLTVKEVYEDAKSGFKDAFIGLKSIADKLEGPAKHVYGVYTNQHRTEGLAKMGMIIFLLVLGIPMFTKHVKDCNNGDWTYHDTYTLLGGIMFFVGLVAVAGFFWGEGFTKVTNPEYYSIQDIIKAFK